MLADVKQMAVFGFESLDESGQLVRCGPVTIQSRVAVKQPNAASNSKPTYGTWQVPIVSALVESKACSLVGWCSRYFLQVVRCIWCAEHHAIYAALGLTRIR